MQYKLHNNLNNKIGCIEIIEKNTFIPLDPDNTDYQAYLKWVSEGNTPLPAEETQ